MVNTHFRLYSDGKSNLQSSVFDLISGDKETKQTKGLAYILSLYPEFLVKFIDIPEIKVQLSKSIGKSLNVKEIGAIDVSAEMVTSTKKRADIVLRIYLKDSSSIAIIIEAKSIKTKGYNDIKSQIYNYLNDGEIADLQGVIKIGIVLSKYRHNIPNVVNLEWSKIITLTHSFCNNYKVKEDSKYNTLRDYFKFITNIENEMYFYEKEVLSIPAGKSHDKVETLGIYECPNNKNFSYKKPIYVTFRKTGSFMEFLYKIDDIVVLNPCDERELENLKQSTIPSEIIKRILAYIAKTELTNEEKRFYILSEDKIELKHKPRPISNIQKHTYFSLSDILTKDRLVPESQK